jgi:hypothetical protein
MSMLMSRKLRDDPWAGTPPPGDAHCNALTFRRSDSMLISPLVKPAHPVFHDQNGLIPLETKQEKSGKLSTTDENWESPAFLPSPNAELSLFDSHFLTPSPPPQAPSPWSVDLEPALHTALQNLLTLPTSLLFLGGSKGNFDLLLSKADIERISFGCPRTRLWFLT